MKLRNELHELIDKYGIDYDKLIEKDRELHNEIIVDQREIMKRNLN